MSLIEKFKKNPPQSPITALNKLKPQSKINISKEEEENIILIKLEVDDQIFEAKAISKQLAVNKVYKKAVKFFNPNYNIIFF